MKASWSILSVSVASLAVLAPAQSFAEGSLTSIRERAHGSRAVIIDFSNDACAPCRRLLETTWADAALWQAFDKRVDVVRVDPEVDTASAKEFDVLAYPTIVLLGDDGKECGRIVGFVAAQELLAHYRQAVQPKPTDWRERQALAKQLARDGKPAEALESYLWLWDHGLESNPSFSGVRVSFFLSELMAFAKDYPPAFAALVARRDRLEKAILAGGVDYPSVSDMVHLNAKLGQRDHSVAVLEKVPERSWQRQQIAYRVLRESAVDHMLDEQQYDKVVQWLEDPVGDFDRELDSLRANPLPERARTSLESRLLGRQAKVLEALFGADRKESYRALVARLLEHDQGVDMWVLIVKAAGRAENDVAMHTYAVQAMEALPAADQDRIRSMLRPK